MDYCSSCRRHLNGALSCPGCGALAPDLDALMEAAAPRVREDGGFPASPRYEEVLASALQGAGPEAAADEYTPAPTQGRAARRRQLARWKKNKRRALIATAVAMVGGGLTVSALPTGSHQGRATAASSPSLVEQGDSLGAAAPTPPSTGASARPSAPADEHPDAAAPPAQSSGPAAGGQTANRPATGAAIRPTDDAAARSDSRATVRPGGSTSVDQPTTAATPRSAGGGSTATPASGTTSAPTTASPATTPPSSGGGATSTAPSTPPPATSSKEPVCILVLCLG